MLFDRELFWVLPLTYFYLPKSARAYLFPQSVKFITFAAAALALTPAVRNQIVVSSRFRSPTSERVPSAASRVAGAVRDLDAARPIRELSATQNQ